MAMSGLRLVFVDGRNVRWDPREGEDIPRGGITTALLALTRELTARGHDVHVVAGQAISTEIDGTSFHPKADFASLCRSVPDAIIAVPDLIPLALPVLARARVAWSGNAFATGDPLVTAPWNWAVGPGKSGRVARILPVSTLCDSLSAFVAKSEWQADQQAAATGLPRELFTVIGNGVPLQHYASEPPAPLKRLIYTSQPRRGLALLLAMLSEIRTRIPDVSLDVYSYEPLDDEMSECAAALGVAVHGALGKAALAEELSRGGVLAYPNTLRETFCTSVAEAQAAGLPVVTSRRGALPERVSHGIDGFLIEGEPGGEDFRRDFVGAVVELLGDPERHELFGRRAKERALHSYSWPSLARTWEQLLSGLADAPPSMPDPNVLAVYSDCLLSDRGRTAAVPEVVARKFVEDAAMAYGSSVSALPAVSYLGKERP